MGEEHWSCLGQMGGVMKKHEEGLGFDDCLGSFQLCGATEEQMEAWMELKFGS